MEITSGPAVELELAGAVITIPSNTVAELWLEKLRNAGDTHTIATPTYIPPRIGAPWYEGTYAGIARGEDGRPDCHLIVLGEAPNAMKWTAALEWPASKFGTCSVLPTRRELALCYANVPELFQAAWYWSSTQYAGNEAYAWCQGFDVGGQGYGHKDGEYRARAVRRLPIE